MSLSITVNPGYRFSASEKVTYDKLNLLGSPVIVFSGQASTSEIEDGAITSSKLASTLDINSKISDNNISLTKLQRGTHGQVLYYDSNGNLVKLSPGTAGYFLRTNGSGADPDWAAQAGISSIAISQITTSGANKFISTDASGNIQWENKSAVYNVATVWHQESTNTNAENSSTSATARKLTNKTDPNSIVTALGSTDFQLAAGTYLFDGLISNNSASNGSSVWLYDTTGTTTLINGCAYETQLSNAENSFVPLKGIFTLGVSSTLEIRQISQTAVAAGWGKAVNLGSQPEVYSSFTVWKIA